MTDLFLSDESKEYQNLARDFFQNEVASKTEKLDHEASFPFDLYKAAWELGLATAFIPEDLGGLGLNLWDSVVMSEEAGAASGGLAAVFEGNALAAAPLLVAGTADQKEQFLSRLTAEPALASFCFPASANGSSFPTASAGFTARGDKFELNAKNVLAINGENASFFVLAASNSDGSELSVFVVPGDAPGIVRGAQIPKLGRRCADICRIDFNRVLIDESNLLGSVGDGKTVLLESSCIGAAITASHAVGLMRCGLEHSVRYSKERQTFGKPLSKHQAVSFMIADIAKNTECARLMTWKAAALFDSGQRDYTQALSAKSFAVDAAMSAATDAVQIYGGYGYSKEYPVERLMRDAKMMQMMSGSSFELKCTIGEELMLSL